MSSIVHGRGIFAAIGLTLAGIAVYGLFFAEKQSAHIAAPQAYYLSDKFKGSDRATAALRSESKSITRVMVTSADERERAAKLGTIIEDYGSFVILARDRSMSAKQFGLEEQELETTINLPGSRFEPIADPPAESLRLGTAATAPGDGYYVVQFGATATDEMMKSVRDAGVEILQYIPHQAYFVYASAESMTRLANHSRVRWIGKYEAGQKIGRVLKGQLAAARNGKALARGISPIESAKGGKALFDIAIFARADADEFAESLKGNLGLGSVRIERLQHNFFNIVRAEVSLTDVERVAQMPDVVGLSSVARSRNEDERSSQILAGNYLNSTTIEGAPYDPRTQFGADGTNVTVSVVDDGVGIPGDGGFYLSSLNVANGPLRGTTGGAFGHGHLNATIIAGGTPYSGLDPLFYNYGKGVAPKANIVNIPRNRVGYTGTDAEVYNDSVTTPGPSGRPAFISNNSWGNGTNGNHYELATEGKFDGFVRDATITGGADPILLIFSAGNSGVDGMTRPKVAKNIITVGNSEGLRTDLGGTSADNMDDIAVDSSRGPAADGRIKPDVVAPGTAITGGRSGLDSLSGNIGTAHRWSSGSSHSAAQISGVAAVFTNWWYDNNFGDWPSPSLVKAALINSSRDLNGNGSSAAIPNGIEGWGRPNMKSMFTPGVGMKYIDEQVPLQTNGDGFDLIGSVADASKPIRVTLAWTDPPGVADPALVNDLDLVVTVDGVPYKGNVFSGGVSVTGGNADNRNNVENVFLPAGIPAGRELKIRVNGTALNGDGILNNGDDTDQNYSLVISNWSGLIAPSFYTVSGRIVSSSQRGVGYAKVRITNGQGIPREVFSNPLGYFHFTGVAAGQYTVTIASKRYAFTQRIESINSNVSNLNFTSGSNAP